MQPQPSSQFAIIATGGKQYLVSEGKRLSIEKIPGAEGSTVSFDQVLLTSDRAQTVVGQPVLAGARVRAKVVRHFSGEKVTVLKYKPKVRYRRKRGHRQELTDIEITKITPGTS